MALSSFIPPAVVIGEAENRRNKVALILVISLFFLWGVAYGLLDVLNKHFQERLSITKARSTLLQAAYFGAYFLFALPAGYIIKRWGYKAGIVTGLSLYSIGAVIFFPATEWACFDMFLFGLFVLATELTCLETAANPYVTILGSSKASAIRLNVAQCFNGVGAFLGPIIGANWFFSSHGSNLTSVKNVYLMISALVISVAVLFIFTKLPESAGKPIFEEKSVSNRLLSSDRNFMGAVVAQFFYVAAQVGIAALFINYCLEAKINIDTAQASYLLAISLFLFAVGRIAGTALMNRIAPQILLSAYGIICLVVSVLVIMNLGVSVGALMAAFFFESIMFPTIFALGIKNLGTQTKKASSILLSSLGFKHFNSASESERINAIYQYSLANYKKKISIEEISAVANLSPNSFCRYFKSKTRKTYSTFILEIRIGVACKLLVDNRMSVKQVCYESGFNNFASFHKYFKAITHKTPLNYQQAYLQKK
jgi:MFS transporter, FHS family, L-fucose permease